MGAGSWHRGRVVAVAGAVLAAAAGCAWVAAKGARALPLVCWFHEATGLHCPGCGMTRALYAALHGHFWMAFRNNPVGVVLLPLALFMLAPDVWRWMRNEAPPPCRARAKWPGLVLAVLLLAFFVLRNLPWEPFRHLAPLAGEAAP